MIHKYAEIFCWKNVSSFCSAKATHILSAKNIRLLYIESTKTVNKMTLNALVKLMTLWTTGPSCLFRLYIVCHSGFLIFEFWFDSHASLQHRLCPKSMIEALISGTWGQGINTLACWIEIFAEYFPLKIGHDNSFKLCEEMIWIKCKTGFLKVNMPK